MMEFTFAERVWISNSRGDILMPEKRDILT